jgi:hypothetical protein
MKSYGIYLIAGVLIACSIVSYSKASVLGDVDRDGKVGLSEAIHALQITTGLRPDASNTYAPVQKTGQSICYSSTNEQVLCDTPENDLPGQDGQTLQGVQWPAPRFTDNNDGTITDNLTGLMWLKDAAYSVSTLEIWMPESNQGLSPESRHGQISWHEALTFVEKLNNGEFNTVGSGNCGFTDWRLPNIRELNSLIHYGVSKPAVPNTGGDDQWSEGDPFVSVKSSPYWSSTTGSRLAMNDDAWIVDLSDGDVKFNPKFDPQKFSLSYVWPVR